MPLVPLARPFPCSCPKTDATRISRRTLPPSPAAKDLYFQPQLGQEAKLLGPKELGEHLALYNFVPVTRPPGAVWAPEAEGLQALRGGSPTAGRFGAQAPEASPRPRPGGQCGRAPGQRYLLDAGGQAAPRVVVADVELHVDVHGGAGPGWTGPDRAGRSSQPAAGGAPATPPPRSAPPDPASASRPPEAPQLPSRHFRRSALPSFREHGGAAAPAQCREQTFQATPAVASLAARDTWPLCPSQRALHPALFGYWGRGQHSCAHPDVGPSCAGLGDVLTALPSVPWLQQGSVWLGGEGEQQPPSLSCPKSGHFQ